MKNDSINSLMLIPENCIKCGNKITNKKSRYQQHCNDCLDSHNKELKGGNNPGLDSRENEVNKESNMATKKSQKEQKMAADKKQEAEQPVASEKKVKGKSITDVRVENANKVIEYMDKELKIDDAEKRKVFSRAYGIVSQKMKKK